ncbi:MAG: sigma-54-dependent Fis family transcriptional regulator [Chitinophagales bacterium]|nr:MAG: sigma-54-dependent Fis family transcriptional regulator [Chitinophagales bacterium]
MDLQSLKNRFGIIGTSPALDNALSIAVRVAPTNLTVLITGESGVGKEIFSQIIHNLSPRKHNPFIAVNCGAIPEGTIDSELFGHEKGSFTGAHEARKGYFETVKDGTIFLDEIGEMPLGTQARLLRVLETGEFIRVGSSKVQKTDVRVIAATNIDLAEFVKKGKFREDLFYRLNTVPIKVPPLRERKEDIYLLFRKFAVDFAERYKTAPISLDEEAKNLLISYPWPGNVRELKNVAEQLSVLAKDKLITADELKQHFSGISRNNLPAPVGNGAGEGELSERDILFKLFFDLKKDLNDLKKFIFEIVSRQKVDLSKFPQDNFTLTNEAETPATPLNYYAESDRPIIIERPEPVQEQVEVEEESLSIAEKEKELIQKALKKHKGKRKYAALDLGISERTLYRKIKEYDIVE